MDYEDNEFDYLLNEYLEELNWHHGITEDLPDELLDEAIRLTEKSLGRKRLPETE